MANCSIFWKYLLRLSSLYLWCIIYFDIFQVKNEDSNTPPDSPNVFSPLFGISNAYFLSQQQQSSITAAATSAALNNLKSPNSALNSLNSPNKIIKDIPSLLSQHPLNPSLIQNLQQLTANPKPDLVQRPSSNPANGKFLRFCSRAISGSPQDRLRAA